jgi:hypothetical protein
LLVIPSEARDLYPCIVPAEIPRCARNDKITIGILGATFEMLSATFEMLSATFEMLSAAFDILSASPR